MNRLALTGHLTGDPELRSTRSGVDACVMRLAVDGPEEANPVFVDVMAFGDLANTCARYLAHGSRAPGLLGVGGRGRITALKARGDRPHDQPLRWRSLKWRRRVLAAGAGRPDGRTLRVRFGVRPPDPADRRPIHAGPKRANG